jgi:hypothetical protein
MSVPSARSFPGGDSLRSARRRGSGTSFARSPTGHQAAGTRGRSKRFPHENSKSIPVGAIPSKKCLTNHEIVAPSDRWVTLMWWLVLSTVTFCRWRRIGRNNRHGMPGGRSRFHCTADAGPSDRRSRERGRMGWACLTVGLVFVASTAAAQHRHPPQDEALHEKFYSTWYMPDNPTSSCCNKADCYPTEIKYVGGSVYARRREDGKYILIPPQKVERNRDNPDGRNHLCAPPPNSSYAADTVFCFSLGGGI